MDMRRSHSSRQSPDERRIRGPKEEEERWLTIAQGTETGTGTGRTAGVTSAITDILATPVSPYHLTNHATIGQAAASLPSAALTPNPGVTPAITPSAGTPTPAPSSPASNSRASSAGPGLHPAQFSSQSKLLFLRGTGGSTDFLHGDYRMQIVLPKNPSDPIQGEAFLQDKNINSGGEIAFDITFNPNSLDKLGRPTTGTFVQDPNIYAGAFFVDTASGTVTIHYFGGGATVAFKGLVYTSGITNPLRNMDLQARGGLLH